MVGGCLGGPVLVRWHLDGRHLDRRQLGRVGRRVAFGTLGRRAMEFRPVGIRPLERCRLDFRPVGVSTLGVSTLGVSAVGLGTLG